MIGMIWRLFLLLLLGAAPAAHSQVAPVVDTVSITITGDRTEVSTDARGVLHVTVSTENAAAIERRGEVHYSDFGAVGDGTTDDIDAIAAAHAFANQRGLPVKADDGATYYIRGERTAIIKTDTDFGNASFTIDDRQVQDRTAFVFLVTSNLQPIDLPGISSLRRNQPKINVSLPGPSLITATDSTTRRYIRFGPNQNSGSAQTDIFLVDADGIVDENTPIIWDFEQITAITALPMDETPLHITGGRFTTIANQAESRYTYYNRNLAIRRSNVVVDGLEHYVVGEGDHGAPYSGFINIAEAANVTVQNIVLTGRKTYRTIGSAGQPVSMGSYDVLVNRALNVSFIDCTQTNDINDRTYWGVMASNYSKNLLYDNCVWSRFDAHMGVANATIRNSTLGYMGINAIGTGTFTVENSTVYGNSFINLRDDYGSTWQGEIVIRNSVFVPAGGRPVHANLIGGRNSGNHDFGYTTYLPERITIESLQIDDSAHPEDYRGPTIFANFNPDLIDSSFEEAFPYVREGTVILRNVTTASGLPMRISDNPFMFKDVQIQNQ